MISDTVTSSTNTWHDYYRDKNKVEVLIKYTFKLPSKVDGFDFDDHPVHVRQVKGEIWVSYHKLITHSLLDDLIKFWNPEKQTKEALEVLQLRNPSQYIIGFIGDTLPRINAEITKKKFQDGHLILRHISQFDIYNVFVVDVTANVEKIKKYIGILWPLKLPIFPPIKQAASTDVTFVKDLIDSMTEYFYFNSDECIRKVITSLENYFSYYKLSVDRGNIFNRIFFPKKTKFKKLVETYIIEKYYPYKERDLSILRSNILTVYQIRNLIVHDKLRLKASDLMFCKKAIGTLLYIYQSKFITDDNKYNYIFALYQQFQIIADMIIGLNLDNFAKAEVSLKKSKLIFNTDKLNKSIFSSLKITKTEKTSIKNQI